MIVSKKFRNKETGEIKTQVNIFELKNYEEVEEVMVYPAYGELYSSLKDCLEGFKIPFETKGKYKAPEPTIHFKANVDKEQLQKLVTCAECTGGFVEVK